MKKSLKIILAVLMCFVLIVAGGVAYLASSGYKAENVLFSDNQISMSTENGVRINKLASGNIEFVPENASTGFIFYPGGSVEYTAYAPLLEHLAENGILCVLVKMPLDLAVFNSSAADGIQKDYPDISRWYIGGHSLGGAMAGTYLSKNADSFDGLILLAAYSTADISQLGKTVISVYGTSDGVMNKENYDKYKGNLPRGFNELIIKGGCHSYFGNYGAQKGDGTPTITREQQIYVTAEYISSLIA